MKLSRIYLEAAQYGLTPKKLLGRAVASKGLPKIIANSLPKSGTNLLLRSLYLLPGVYRRLQKTLLSNNDDLIERTIPKIKSGQICSAHLKYSIERARLLEENNVKHLLMVRDPRDVAVSNYIYITYKDTGHRLHHHFKNILKTDEERLNASINGLSSEELEGQKPSLSLASHYQDYLAWIKNCQNVKLVKFENLVGSAGGGSATEQRGEIVSMVNHIGLDIADSDIEYVMANLFSTVSRTFNKGQIGSWQKHFKGLDVGGITEQLSPILHDLGYDI